jgi:subtilisin family serine protease
MGLKFSRTIVRLVAVIAAFAVAFPASAASRIPNDVYFEDQWYLRKIGAPEAWVSSLGLESVPIAFIDSGVDSNHPDLKDNIWRNPTETPGDGVDNDANGYVDDVHGWDFVDGDADARPDARGEHSTLGTNHGTIGAGVAAARGDNGKGIVGVTWQATIMPLRVLDSNGSGDPGRVVRAVEYAVHNGAKVINLSFAGPTYSKELEIALRRAYDAGVFVVAAAGNAPDGGQAVNLDTRPLYPVCFDRESSENFVYGVAATDGNDRKAEFSNYGAGCIDMAAPGTRVLSTQYYVPGDAEFGQPYGGYFNGTSVAAPVVSGVVALIRALDRNLTPKQIMNILTESAADVNGPNPEYFGKVGRGRIDAAKAVERVASLRKGGDAPVATASLAPPGTARYVVTAPGAGRAPDVRLFTEDGTFIRGFAAFPTGFRGGVSLALADFDGTARQTIVTGALAGGAPHVRIFDINTRAIGGFYAYDERFGGGVRVATGDVDGDGKDEIVTGAGPGGGPHIRVFRPNGVAIGGFFAFDKDSRGGVEVAVADVDGDGKRDIVAASQGAVRVFDAKGVRKEAEFFPYGRTYRGGVNLSVADVDGDGKQEITTVRVQKGKSVASAFRATGAPYADIDLDAPTPQFTAAAGGIAPAKPGAVLWFGSPALAAPSVIGAYAGGNKAPSRFQVYESKFFGGVSAAVTR